MFAGQGRVYVEKTEESIYEDFELYVVMVWGSKFVNLCLQ